MTPYVANSLWIGSGAREHLVFRRATREVESTQRALLAATTRANRESDYGRASSFETIRSAEEFRRRVPVVTYDDLERHVDRIKGGEPNVLTCDPVRLLEPTGGSTRAAKLVPYTTTLRRQFNRAIDAWLFDLYRRRRHLLSGTSYWSITPLVARETRTSGGIPVGFDDDTEYLGPVGRRLARHAIAVPSDVRHVADPELFRYVTALFLLADRRLALVSVWNPSFLTILLNRIASDWERLAFDVERGRIDDAGELPEPLRIRLEARLGASPHRAREIRAAFAGGVQSPFAACWPKLGLVSCWMDANAALPAAQLARELGRVEMQPKGLLATEAACTFPFGSGDGAVLAIRSHFFEFVRHADGELFFAWELERGELYRIVVTTGGGLHRYDLGDLVEVVAFEHACPRLRFVGRADAVSDWRGEKLSEAHVRSVVERLFAGSAQPRFALVSCGRTREAPRYTLFVEPSPTRSLASLARELDALLSENPQYAWCRDLGQLAAPRVVAVANGAERLVDAAVAAGQRAGDVKPPLLDRDGSFAAVLERSLEGRDDEPQSS